MPIRILIADDHPVVIEGVKLMLKGQNDIQLVYEANNGHKVIEFTEDNSVDVYLLDIEMPEMNGVKTTEALIAKNPETKIIAFSSYNDITHLQIMLKAGVKGFLLKNCSQSECIEAIQKVYQGYSYYSDELTDLMIAIVQGKKTQKDDKGKFIATLSRREKEILKLIVDESTTSEIAEKLFISIGTVETHRRNMLNKLDVKNTAGLVRMAIQYNLI